MSINEKPIRVLIVEDSPVCRELLISLLNQEPGFQVVGVARDGAEGVRLAKRLQPDIITMDVYMPVMDGYEAARQIMHEIPCPIVMISSRLNKREHNLTFNALQAGALSILDKPAFNDSPDVHQQLLLHLRLMSEVKVVRRWSTHTITQKPMAVSTQLPVLPEDGSGAIQLVVMAASTGGPSTLVHILQQLPDTFPVPVLIVQHVTAGFAQGLADWLNSQIALSVQVGSHAYRPQPGQVIIAPDNYHMLINKQGRIVLSKTPPVHGLRPAADYLFQSTAEAYGKNAVGVILTGMGNDGAQGLQAMNKVGAYTIAQDEASCVVFGMPAAAIKLNAVTQVQPSNRIADSLLQLTNHVRV